MNDFGKDEGLVHEAVVTGRKVGAGEQFWATLAHSERAFRSTVAFVMSLAIFRLTPVFDRDMVKEGWKELEKDSPDKDGEFGIELLPICRDGEPIVNGEELERRAEAEGNLAGQRHLEAMLRNQERIPVEYRDFPLVAPDTVWGGVHRTRIVAVLCWDGNSWHLRFFSIINGFSPLCRFVRLSKQEVLLGS